MVCNNGHFKFRVRVLSFKIAEELVAQLEPLLDQNIVEFHGNEQTPHIVIDEFLNEDLAQRAESEFPPIGDARWNYNFHFNEKKLGYNLDYELPPSVKSLVEALSSKPFVRYLEKLTKIDCLVPDYNHSTAMHYALAGGFINLHMDPNVHVSNHHLERRVNLLLYLNGNWKESFGGELQIWDSDVTKCYKKVLPAFNRCIIFDTKKVMHGFPDPITCPKDDGRKAIVMYYFTRHNISITQRITDYKARPSDSLPVKIKIYFGRVLLYVFYFLRDHFNLSQDTAGKLTKFVETILSLIKLRK